LRRRAPIQGWRKEALTQGAAESAAPAPFSGETPEYTGTRPSQARRATGVSGTIRRMDFDFQPTLTGPLVTLRPLRNEDFPALYAVASDPLLWALHPEPERAQEPVFRDFFRVAMASKSALLALDSADGQVIGTSRYHGYDPLRSEIEIGWTFLARSHWGGRHNRDMKRLMLGHAFRFVENVLLIVGENNLRSRRAVEKIGGTLTDTRRETRHGVDVYYRVTASAFTAEGGLGSES
jgi:RimJ/RimL family protein N-acetyltransferase